MSTSYTGFDAHKLSAVAHFLSATCITFFGSGP